MEKGKGISPSGVGVSSLLVIFGVLCLVVLALLSIATVRAGERLGDSNEAAVLGYYRADSQAEQILAQLRAGEVPEGVTEENGIYSYRCPISESQVLAVRVTVQGQSYEILQWQAVSVTQWNGEDTLPVWKG